MYFSLNGGLSNNKDVPQYKGYGKQIIVCSSFIVFTALINIAYLLDYWLSFILLHTSKFSLVRYLYEFTTINIRKKNKFCIENNTFSTYQTLNTQILM
jgi:hypothetical protein